MGWLTGHSIVGSFSPDGTAIRSDTFGITKSDSSINYLYMDSSAATFFRPVGFAVYLAAAVDQTLATTGASGTGSVATLTFGALASAPYPIGSTITVGGVTPLGYNGSYIVTACTTSSVSYASTTTGAQTLAGVITVNGTVGQQICISDSGGGGNPDGMMAFWDTTNTRWSYIHDNSAV